MLLEETVPLVGYSEVTALKPRVMRETSSYLRASAACTTNDESSSAGLEKRARKSVRLPSKGKVEGIWLSPCA